MLGVQDGLDRFDRKTRIDVSRPQVNNSHNWLALKNCQSPEIAVVRDDDAVFGKGPADQSDVGRPDQLLFANIEHVNLAMPQKLNDIGMDILIGQQFVLLQPHEPISAIVSTSFFTA